MARRRREGVGPSTSSADDAAIRDAEEGSTEEVHDVLEAGVILEAVDGEVLSVAGVLEAAVRHLGDDRDVGVDPDAAEVEAPGHSHRAAMVAGEDAAGQAVLDAVR